MFTRIVKVKKKDKTLGYLRLVENYKEKVKTKQRVITNFGNAEKLNVRRIDSAISSLLKLSSQYFYDIRKLTSKSVQHFYRAMDSLIEHKETIEEELHEQVKDLFNINLNLSFL